MKRGVLIILLAVFCLPAFLQAQQNQSPVTIAPVAGPVYMLQGAGGGNVGFVADRAGSLVVDAMDERSAIQIRTMIQNLPGGDKIRFLVNTHYHNDHTDGNKVLGAASIIVAQENTRSFMLANSKGTMPDNAVPAVTYPDKMTVYAGMEPVRLVHYPHAHTDGDTLVFIDKFKVVHMGDMFFNGMFPFLDVPNGGDIDNWIRQLDSIMASLPADTKIIPGHGPLAGIAELKAFRQMLSDSAEAVRKQMNDGKTLEQIKAAGLPEHLTPWTKGFLPTAQWIELVYRSLERNITRR